MTRSKASKGSVSKRSKSSATKPISVDRTDHAHAASLASRQRNAKADTFWSEYRRCIREGGFSSGPSDCKFQELKKQFGIVTAARKDETSSFVIQNRESDEDNSKPRPDAYWVMPREIQYALTKYFTEVNSKPSTTDRETILLMLQQFDASITLSKVTRWFQNRRAYVKRCG